MASAPSKSSTLGVRPETGGGSNVSAPAGSGVGSAARSFAGMCAKTTGLAQTDQIESAGAQAAKAWCLFIVGLRAEEKRNVHGSVINHRRARDAGGRAAGPANDYVDAGARGERAETAGGGR